ncbi:SusC/RagA family TonB-linked outer membrane protein [Spirosoma sp. HMF3257]|uniref:SusC/RagA family TonB-linked outer membrane protein n=2 Tax=Spirosoma telluris TaxID=2183553 RepID=A0A327NSX7_9BACT|nr:SusC/RagA family TonB-linked outer membrane protein [Spirosoma telluris]RAI78490.1 SusC/RagA family TonB-linked outer membrane protein [Spirosoma telluris]
MASARSLSQQPAHPATAVRVLKDVLNEWGLTFGVNILYEESTVDGLTVSMDAIRQTGKLEQRLDNLLKPLRLTYRKRGKSYLITPVKRQDNTSRLVNPTATSIASLPIDGITEAHQAVSTANVPAQLVLSGRITSETGDGLPGVSVVVKGTTIGTATDGTGMYKLNIPDAQSKGTLIFSFIGYETQEVTIGNQTTINLQLKPSANSIDEVVVVGYGTQSRRNVTGSVTKIDMKQTENLPNTNVSQALRGRVAGVQFTDNGRPGQAGTILVRGQRSISAGNNPLVILDGIFFDGSLNDINPGDIESMEVLKDASATAIYGARAANGVILITSKRGTSEKPTIRISSYYGASSWSYKPKLLTPDRYIEKTLEWRRQSGLDADLSKIGGYMTPTEAKNYAAGTTVDPWKAVSQVAGIQNYDVSISGRSARTNYFVSGNFNKDRGLIYNDKATRTSARINLDNQITSWLKIGVNAQFAERDLSGNEGSVINAYGTSPFSNVWLDAAHTDPAPVANEDGLIGGILFDAIIKKNREIQRNLFANFYGIVDIPFVEGLTYRVNYSPNYRWYNLDNFTPIYQRNSQNYTGSASRQTDLNKNWVLENIVTYSRQIGEAHNLDLTLLYGRNEAYSESITASGSDFTGTSDANGWNNLALAKIQTNTSSASDVNAISSMIRLNYRFKDRYLLTLTTRRDGNSVFGASHKFGIFPSAAVAWIASDEPFFKAIPLINMLKFRASYGSVGNQAISAYKSLTQQGQVQYVYGDGGTTSTGIYPLNLANPNLKWETTTTANLGVDFEIWKGRISSTIELYSMDTKDLLLTRQLPSPTGFATILTNVGSTNNKGIELTVNTLNIKKGLLEWSSNGTFSTNKNKIVHLYRSDANGDGVEDNDVSNKWFIGQPVSVAYDYRIAGVYQVGDQIPAGQKAGFLRLQDVNGDGVIDANDRQVLGTLQPKYRWSFTNNFRYGHVNLMVMLNALQGWLGSDPRLALTQNAGGNGNGNLTGRASNFIDTGWWTPENKSNTVSSLVYTNPYNHGYYESRDFVRIQEVSLSYDFPRSLITRLKMTNLKAYVSGRNLYTFTKWRGMDPESGSTPSDFPMPRTVSVGLNMSF